jgi:hypothetical protein
MKEDIYDKLMVSLNNHLKEQNKWLKEAKTDLEKETYNDRGEAESTAGYYSGYTDAVKKIIGLLEDCK